MHAVVLALALLALAMPGRAEEPSGAGHGCGGHHAGMTPDAYAEMHARHHGEGAEGSHAGHQAKMHAEHHAEMHGEGGKGMACGEHGKAGNAHHGAHGERHGVEEKPDAAE